MQRPLAAVALATAWFLGLVLALDVAAATRVGPVLVLLVPGHGIHLGDLLALALGAAYGTAITFLLLPAAMASSR